MQPLAKFKGTVVRGFGRGSRELGIPTANLDDSSIKKLSLENGIYYGYCRLISSIYPMVMSIGNNDFYKNTNKSVEVHLIERCKEDFYGAKLSVLVYGFIREMKDFQNVAELIDEIHNDIRVAKKSLELQQFPNLNDFE